MCCFQCRCVFCCFETQDVVVNRPCPPLTIRAFENLCYFIWVFPFCKLSTFLSLHLSDSWSWWVIFIVLPWDTFCLVSKHLFVTKQNVSTALRIKNCQLLFCLKRVSISEMKERWPTCVTSLCLLCFSSSGQVFSWSVDASVQTECQREFSGRLEEEELRWSFSCLRTNWRPLVSKLALKKRNEP